MAIISKIFKKKKKNFIIVLIQWPVGLFDNLNKNVLFTKSYNLLKTLHMETWKGKAKIDHTHRRNALTGSPFVTQMTRTFLHFQSFIIKRLYTTERAAVDSQIFSNQNFNSLTKTTQYFVKPPNVRVNCQIRVNTELNLLAKV